MREQGSLLVSCGSQMCLTQLLPEPQSLSEDLEFVGVGVSGDEILQEQIHVNIRSVHNFQ